MREDQISKTFEGDDIMVEIVKLTNYLKIKISKMEQEELTFKQHCLII